MALVSISVFSSGLLCSIAALVTEHQRRKGLAAVLRVSESLYIGKFLFLT